MGNNNSKYYVNENIRFRDVLVIDENGNNLGRYNISDAMALAENHDLDLVCINTNYPYTCKLMNFSKFMYEQKKKRKEMIKANKAAELKEYKFRYNISKHDIMVKCHQIQENLLDGCNIHLIMVFKGRETTKKSFGMNTLKEILGNLTDYSFISEIKDHDGVIDCTIKKKK